MTLLIALIVLALFLGGGGSVYNGGAYRNYGYGGIGVILVILLVVYLLGGFR